MTVGAVGFSATPLVRSLVDYVKENRVYKDDAWYRTVPIILLWWLKFYIFWEDTSAFGLIGVLKLKRQNIWMWLQTLREMRLKKKKSILEYPRKKVLVLSIKHNRIYTHAHVGKS